MKNNKRIVFMGTPAFAVETLKNISNTGYNIVGVVCPPDRPSGRGQKLQSCEVKNYAVSKNFNVLQPIKLKDPHFISDLKALEADLFIVVAFRMLPIEVWSIPKYGTFNIHASLLPNYRGAAPINWAIINGETKTGVTSFFIDEKIDTGAILLSKSCTINEDETAGDLHDKLMVLGAEVACETCEQIFNKKITPSQQDTSTSYKNAPKLFKQNCRIDWQKSSEEIYNHIRGLAPYPIAWTTFQLKNNVEVIIKIHKATSTIINHDKEIGFIEFGKKHLHIYTADGFINVSEIQAPGKKKMDISSFLNGFQLPIYTIAR